MEMRLGHDFSRVQVHTGPRAGAAALAANALAYTSGHRVVFAPGLYAPGTASGDDLLAHELTHVALAQPNAGSATAIHCYESPEHQDLGDQALRDLDAFLKTPEGRKWAATAGMGAKAVAGLPQDQMLKGAKIKVGPHRLTAGEVISLMGDFFKKPEDIAAASPAEIKEILDTITKERKGEITGAQANERYQDITLRYRKNKSETFLNLARDNSPHFTPTNRDAWKALHIKAIAIAKANAVTNKDLDQALLYDAAGGHFLTDAFASGHLFDKNVLEREIKVHLARQPARPENPEMSAYFALADSQDVMHQLVLKNVHDRMNAEGVTVKNAKGMQWKTFGDAHLKLAPETRRLGALAVYQSRRQVTEAFQHPNGPDPDPQEVLDLLPDKASVDAATKTAVSYIPEAVKEVTGLLYRQRAGAKLGLKAELEGMPDIPLVKSAATRAVPWLVEANLATIASPGRQKQLEDIRRLEEKHGKGLVAPSLTIGEW